MPCGDHTLLQGFLTASGIDGGVKGVAVHVCALCTKGRPDNSQTACKTRIWYRRVQELRDDEVEHERKHFMDKLAE